jgi:two-component system chemotaxis response regulator CheB
MAETPAVAPVQREESPALTAQRDIVVIGASAGGVEALDTLMTGLPLEFPAAVFVVLHMLPTGHSVLPEILARAGPLPAAAAQDGEDIERGRVYVAPPDRHLLVMKDGVKLTHGPRENGHRPSVDPLFRSAARAFRERVIAVVLSGSLDDGTAGLRMVKRRGGTTVVQDPEDALYPGMPASAVANDGADYMLPVAQMATLLCDLVDAPVEVHALGNPGPEEEDVDQADRSDDDPTAGDLTSLTCPECGGTLWETIEGGFLRFKCHVGHAYSPESLETAQSEGLEMALWSALRALEERGDLFRRLARRAGVASRPRFEQRAEDVKQHAEVIRENIQRLGRMPPPVQVDSLPEKEVS